MLSMRVSTKTPSTFTTTLQILKVESQTWFAMTKDLIIERQPPQQWNICCFNFFTAYLILNWTKKKYMICQAT